MSELRTGTTTIDAGDSKFDEAKAKANSTEDQPESAKPTNDEQTKLRLDADDDAPSCADTLDEDGRKGARRRRFVAFGVAALVAVLFVTVIYFWLLAGSDEEHRVQSGANARHSEAAAKDGSTHAMTAEEIRSEYEKARNANSNSTTNTAAPPNNSSQTNANVTGAGSPITDRLPLGDYSTTVVAPPSSAVTPSSSVAPQTSATTSPAHTNATNAVYTNATMNATTANAAGSPNAERSIRISQLQNTAREETSPARVEPSDNTIDSANEAGRTHTASVALPPLGTMLPVRTLGTLYTLRAEGYVRMQLVRAASGAGWSLPRGAELYGQLRGSDYEIGRAYVQLVGFVDPRTNGFVRLEGSIVGADGSEGLRGHKRSLTSGWTRALRIAGAGAVEALSTVAATVGRRPVYVGDIYSTGAPRVTSPLMRELNGIAYREGQAGLVEVPAGTRGYILMMTVPREINGTEARAGELRRLTDSTNRSVAEGQLSETELAELITNGNADDIRRALPRMTPEMRRVASAALAQ
ncbi:MAG: hypothetical protein M3R15_25165 [Acidobacteriota bacterium]|nr:hypothetical protein [Acidobacteriota bacterium]